MLFKKIFIILVSITLASCASNPPGDGGGNNTSNDDMQNLMLGTLVVSGGLYLYSQMKDSDQNINNSKDNIDDITEKHVKQHEIKPMKRWGNEEDGYAMYSYLVFPRLIETHNAQSDIARKYKAALLALKQSGLRLERDSEIQKLYPKSVVNLLLIPYKKEFDFALSDYNFNLADEIIQKTAIMADNAGLQAIAQQFRRNEGPYILTTNIPISSKSGQKIYVLFADLSRLPEPAIKQAIVTYKNRLENPDYGNKPFEKVENLKISILSFLTNLNDDLKVFSLISSSNAAN